MDLNTLIGQRIKHFRKLHNFTQEELAAIIRVDAGHIANIEKGRKGISLEKLVLVCTCFNISLSDLFPINVDDDSELRSKLINEILYTTTSLDTNQLLIVKTMVCSLATG